MGQRLLLARSFEEPMPFDLQSIRDCIEKLPITNLTEQGTSGELIRGDYRAKNDIAHLSVDSDLFYISTEARVAGYDLAYRFAKCLGLNLFIVLGDSPENPVSLEDCHSPEDLEKRLSRR